MRTTVILDHDVAAAVARLRSERHIGVSEALNQLVRAGLTEGVTGGRRSPKFRQRTVTMGAIVDLRDIADVLEITEGPGFH